MAIRQGSWREVEVGCDDGAGVDILQRDRSATEGEHGVVSDG